MKLPFDAYLVTGTKKTFIKANTWLSDVSGVSATANSYTFILPVWVTEQQYTLASGKPIETRVVAENCPNRRLGDYVEVNTGKNGAITHYIAARTIDVEVIGKIYDLRVSSCDDPGWYNQIKGDYVTAINFPFGQANQNKLSAYKYAPKLGYSFVFDFKTKGRKSNSIDLSIYPEYYFVSKTGGNAEKVDLYYSTAPGSYTKIDESVAQVPLQIKLTNAYLKVPSSEMVDSRRIYLKEIGKTYNYTSIVTVGTFAHMLMPHDLRLCYNNFAEYVVGTGKGGLYGTTESKISIDAGSRDNVIGSVGHWYAGYRLPSSTIAIKEGANVKTATKKTNGYILVKFNMKTKYQNWDYLQYQGPEALNEAQKITLPNGKTAIIPKGTIALFETDYRANNDFETEGTH